MNQIIVLPSVSLSHIEAMQSLMKQSIMHRRQRGSSIYSLSFALLVPPNFYPWSSQLHDAKRIHQLKSSANLSLLLSSSFLSPAVRSWPNSIMVRVLLLAQLATLSRSRTKIAGMTILACAAAVLSNVPVGRSIAMDRMYSP